MILYRRIKDAKIFVLYHIGCHLCLQLSVYTQQTFGRLMTVEKTSLRHVPSWLKNISKMKIEHVFSARLNVSSSGCLFYVNLMYYFKYIRLHIK